MRSDGTGLKGNKVQLIESLERLKNEAARCRIGEEYKNFIIRSADLFLRVIAIDKKNTGNYYKNTNFESLLIENNDLYRELLPQHYEKSYANPEYCSKLFGAAAGQAMASIYYCFKSLIREAYLHKTALIVEYAGALMRLFEYIKGAAEIKAEPVIEIERSLTIENLDEKKEIELNEKFNPGFNFYKDIVGASGGDDLRYLFRYGCYISYNEIKTADHLNRLDENEILKLAGHIAGAFIEGFTTENKDRGARNFVKIIFCAGFERVVKAVMADFAKRGFEVIISSVVSTNPNRQADYDHRYDEKPLLSDEYNAAIIGSYKNAFDRVSNLTAKFSGQIRIGKFGETPFSPAESKFSRTLNKKEQDLYNKLTHEAAALFSEKVPDKNTSFSIISFPTPDIGDNFSEIFREILRINTLDTNKYILIQQKIIDALDRADFVRVKGAGKNKTDIRVKMHKLADPEKHTNFYNCGADVNIPAGEVFTTPMLKGTEGTLHIEETYLSGFNYIDLTLKFKNGVITGYSCKNFKSAAENKKYIEQNLFSLKKDLPIGEFAIGTNTLAYAAAKKFDILHKLPILITEKMGPHFAIGDSCYLYVEEIPIYNQINKKEITARDNERTILRKTDLQKAYTFVHVDITLPYESIGAIAAVSASGKRSVSIIENGRFVLKGCEELNKPLEGILSAKEKFIAENRK
jgi:leucyl aminopeptidase (aminopeptidase T)